MAADLSTLSRYVPRIEKGRDLYVLGIRDKIEKKDWEGITAIFEKVSMAQEDSEKQALGLDAKISKIENELLVPMKARPPLSPLHTRDDTISNFTHSRESSQYPDVIHRYLCLTILYVHQVWSTSFAEKGTNPKQRKLDSKIAILKEALDAIQAAISTKDQAVSESIRIPRA